MHSFFQTLLAVFIAQMLGPSFSQFLNRNNNKEEERLKNLEDAYLLALKIQDYCRQMPSHIAMLIAVAENTINSSSVPKLPEEPFSKIRVLLDYHLKAPDELLRKIETLNSETLWSMRPVAEAVNKPQDKDKLYLQAVEQALTTAAQGSAISNEIIDWIKNEKIKIESAVSVFQAVYWFRTLNKMKHKFVKLES